jgi:hypothetical protein
MQRFRLHGFGKIAVVMFLSVITPYYGAEVPTGRAPEWIKQLDRANKAEAVLLSDDQHGKIAERTKRKVLNRVTVDQLKLLFKADANWNGPKNKCEPVYGARLLYHLTSSSKQKDKTLVLNLCLHCDEFFAEQNGKSIDHGNFRAAMHPALLEIFRALFPDDRQLTIVK